jgi:ferredoxin
MLVIDPEECIDCAMCETECPVEAIVSEDDLAEDQHDFLALNEKFSAKWPVITTMKPAPDDAKDWETVENKRQYIEE